jgi:hypothetical protein
MSLKNGVAVTCLAGLAALLLPALGGGQEKKETVYRGVSSALLEKVLAGMDIRYRKSSGKTTDTNFYDFERNGFKIRLGNHGGKDLGIDAIFPRVALERINEWNVKAKFSRAVLAREGDRELALIEAQLDCLPGVTESSVRQFITRFDSEVRNFDRFLSQ